MIPVFEPLIGPKELQYVDQCLRTGWISSAGSFISEFEAHFAAYIGMKHGIAVNNGTNALIVAADAMGLPRGSEVILPTFTIISCVLACIQSSLKPVLVDSEPDTWNMDVRQIEAKITNNTKAIMVVHIYGHPVDMEPIQEIARKYGLRVIEDAAEVIGAEYKGKKCGSFGDPTCFSFYANKTITTGEGGMVLTNSDSLAEKLRSLRNLSFLPQRRFYHEDLGYNFRMTNIQAAIGLAQLESIEDHIARKRRIAQHYDRLLSDIASAQLPVEKKWAKNIYWVYGIVVDEKSGMDGKRLSQELLRRDIETRPFFLGMHEQPVLNKMGLFVGERYPVAERLARQGLYVPSGMTISENQIKTVSQALHEVLK